MRTLWLALLLLLVAPRILAQDASESPADIVARVHYERAVRAEIDQKWDEAQREAEATLDAAPTGKFAAASRALIDQAKQHGVQAQEPSSGQGPRIELIISSTVVGLYLGSFAAAALANNDSSGKLTVGLLMLGTGGGLATSLLATSGRQVPQSMPGMLDVGFLYGTGAAGLLYAISGSDGNPFGALLAGASAGIVTGLIASPHLTGGDSGAALAGMIYGAALPLLLEESVANPANRNIPLWTLLIGGTTGIIAGPLLNRRAHFSRGRWNLITLGGAVGALMGAGTGVLGDLWKSGDVRGAVAVTTLGTLGGLALTTWLTSGFGVDEPRGTALLHLEGGKASLGNALTSIAPTMQNGHLAPVLQMVEGRF